MTVEQAAREFHVATASDTQIGVHCYRVIDGGL